MIFTLTGHVYDNQLFHDFEVAEPVAPGDAYQWLPIRGLVDTGAQDSHIHKTVAARMTLPLLNTSNVSGIHDQPVEVEVRRIITRWTSSEGDTIIKPFQMKVGMGISASKAEALIGMDMIKWFVLTVDHGAAYKMVGNFDPSDLAN